MTLVVGGSGYIGSHLVKELVKTEQVIVLDNDATGHVSTVKDLAKVIKGDMGDPVLLRSLFSKYPIKAVMLCCMKTWESCKADSFFGENN